MTRSGLVRAAPEPSRNPARSGRVVLGLAADATLSYRALAAGAARTEGAPSHQVAVHVGAPHTLWESRGAGRGRRDVQVSAHRWGDVVVTAPGERTSARWDRDTRFVVVSLGAARIEEARLALGLPPSRRPTVGRFSHVDPTIRDAVLALFRGGFARADEALGREVHLDAIASRLVGPAIPPPEQALAPTALGRVLERIHDELGAAHRLADLAALAGTSRFHFARRFRRATGLSPHAYLLEARVHEAARLLVGGAAAADVARAVGFGSRAHLARQLQRRLGTTPGALRKEAHGHVVPSP